MKPFLIIGGYGTVGAVAAKALRSFAPDLPIILGGRNQQKAEAAAEALGNAQGVTVDTQRKDLGLAGDLKLSGIALLTNDVSTHPASYAIQHGIPYTSIATQLTHIAPKLAVQISGLTKAASLIQDTSFAGTLVVTGLALLDRFSHVETINVGAVMDDQDLGGPASQSDTSDFGDKAPGFIYKTGSWVQPDSAESLRAFELLDGTTYEAESFPSLDAPELVASSTASSVRLDFTFGETPGRRDHGQPSVEVVYEITGTLTNGEHANVVAQLSHPRGQTVLTGIGVAVAIESLLGLPGARAVPPGLYLPSTLIDPTHMLQRLRETGAELRMRSNNGQTERLI